MWKMEWIPIFCLLLVAVQPQVLRPSQFSFDVLKCPQHWLQFQDSCYHFIKSPLRAYADARKICQAYEADLLAINTAEEHGFIMHQLTWKDPQHRKWYTAAQQQNPNYWTNPVDGSQLINMDQAFLPVQNIDDIIQRNNLAYSYSDEENRWGFMPVRGDELLLFICEAPMVNVQYLVGDERTYTYGVEINNPEEIPQGPYFIQQPVDRTFDLSKRNAANDISLSCLAGGYPTPTYEWFREDFENDRLVARKIDPLSDIRYTISGGAFIIHNPEQRKDRGSYHCKATNKFGSIISESVQLNFGYISEFNLKRSPESGDQNWGKAVYCDPPQHYPRVEYYWSRDFFPNFVEEDKRVFVSYDGALYFSALENIDRGNYSCSVKSSVSDTGRNGPFFPVRVNPHSNYQQLKFANNFPKSYPDAPKAGENVRLECMAFGYPVPNYNWTRKGGSLPRHSYQESFGRVLIIPKVKVEDQGDYTCRVYNDRSSEMNALKLNIQAEPNFTIPLTDKHVDIKADATWTCEAFGIPDVNYTWWKNGQQLRTESLDPEDRDRYHIQDNVFTIKYVDPERDPGMYQCRAENHLKIRYSSAQLRVLSLKPSFKKKPLESETYAAEQGNVTIYCNPEAAPRPKFVWKKDGNVIGSGGHRRILDNGNLIISPVSRDDEGLYTCRASNEYGFDESQGRLIVLHGPRLLESLQPKIVMVVNYTLDLHCNANTEDFLDIAYTWTHNGMDIRDTDVINNNRMRVEDGYLNIVNTSFADAGDYRCIVKSAVGQVSSKTSVVIHGPPGQPGGVQVINIEKTSVKLQWIDGISHGRPIVSYTITGRTNWNRTWVTIAEDIYAREEDRNTNRKTAYIEDVLTPWSVYEFQIAASNELGMGPPSSPSPQHATPPDRPYIAPKNVGGGGGKIGDLTITWDPLRPEEQNGDEIHYKVYWRRHKADIEFQKLSLKQNGNVGAAVVSVSQQFYFTQFDVKVQAMNSVGEGPESPIITIYSAEDMPQVAPQQVQAKSFNSTCLNVSWIPIDQSRERLRGQLIGHRLKYWKEDIPEENSVYYLSRTTKSWALIVGLQPDTNYYVKVMAYNAAGEGPESERFYERTFRKAPQKPPSSVNVYGVNPSTVRVVWRYVAPSFDEEPLIGYKIRVWEIDQDMSTANDTLILVGGKLEAYITDLSPGKTYRMRVLAYSNGGDGRMSSPPLTFQMGHADAFRNSSSILSTDHFLVLLLIIFGHILYQRFT